jgi:hypothetical protein
MGLSGPITGKDAELLERLILMGNLIVFSSL